MDVLLEAMKKDEVHLATKVSLTQFRTEICLFLTNKIRQVLAQSDFLEKNIHLYSACPVLVFGSCKCELVQSRCN